jgi:hypothetical protein
MARMAASLACVGQIAALGALNSITPCQLMYPDGVVLAGESTGYCTLTLE